MHSSLASAEDGYGAPKPTLNPLSFEQLSSQLARYYGGPAVAQSLNGEAYFSLSGPPIIPQQSQSLIYSATEEE